MDCEKKNNERNPYDRDERAFFLIRQRAESIRHETTVNVSDSRTGNPKNLSPALPNLRKKKNVFTCRSFFYPGNFLYLKGEFEILSPPNQKTRIVTSEFQEVFPIYSE